MHVRHVLLERDLLRRDPLSLCLYAELICPSVYYADMVYLLRRDPLSLCLYAELI